MGQVSLKGSSEQWGLDAGKNKKVKVKRYMSVVDEEGRVLSWGDNYAVRR